MTTITVKGGDTLTDISRRTHVSIKKLMAANPSIHDADEIRRGQRLVLPGHTHRREAPPMPRVPDAVSTSDESVPARAVYPPGSPEQVQLFRAAAQRAGLPEAWASARGLVQLLTRESGGVVGRPNYTYGARGANPANWPAIHDELRQGQKRARSSATGLGQLLLRNVDRYYPDGRRGIGDAMNEAIGMLRYIRDRYGSPNAAWAAYGRNHEGY